MRMFWLLCFLSLIYCTQSVVLKVGAFNIQVFGPTKASKPEVMETIVKIVSAYDIVLVQEIRDKSGGCMKKLLEGLNSKSSEEFTYVNSTRLGRTTSKEQYAYYYKPSKVKVIGRHLFNDIGDKFEREPFAIHIKVVNSTQDLVLVGEHIKPSEAKPEIDAMIPAINEFKTVFGTENMLIMGDMNADCSYMSSLKLKATDLFSDDKFRSLIANDKDTTTSNTDCAYDRIIATGDLKTRIVHYGIEHFEVEFELTAEEAKKVSDHYPVWAELTLDD